MLTIVTTNRACSHRSRRPPAPPLRVDGASRTHYRLVSGQPRRSRLIGFPIRRLVGFPIRRRIRSSPALVHAADCRNQWTEDENTALEHAFELARTGVEIALGLPDAHWVLSYV